MAKHIQVSVSGTVLYKTNDDLIAAAVKESYKGIGWKNVKTVKDTKNEEAGNPSPTS